MSSTRIDAETLRRLPKAVLHDHLDGGLRPATVVELAASVGHTLPTTDPDELAAWYYEAANSGDLVRYIATFEHTLAVMQSREGCCAPPRSTSSTWPPTASSTARSATPRADAEGRPRPRRGRRDRPGGLAAAWPRRPPPARRCAWGPCCAACGCSTGPARPPTSRWPSGTRASSASTSRAPRTASARRPPRRLRAPAPRERPVHHPRRRGPRPAQHPPGAPGVRRPAHRPRRPHHRRHPRPGGRQARPARRLGARPPDRPGDVPHLQPPDRRRDLDRRAPITALKDLGFRVTLNTDNRLVSGTTMTREMSLLVEEAAGPWRTCARSR